MTKAICIKCGKDKQMPWKVCIFCGFDPKDSTEDLVKSVYLSVGRYMEEDHQKHYMEELHKIGIAIAKGEQPVFDPNELNRLSMQKLLMDDVPLGAPWYAVLQLLFPGFIIFIILATILFALKIYNALR